MYLLLNLQIPVGGKRAGDAREGTKVPATRSGLRLEGRHIPCRKNNGGWGKCNVLRLLSKGCFSFHVIAQPAPLNPYRGCFCVDGMSLSLSTRLLSWAPSCRQSWMAISCYVVWPRTLKGFHLMGEEGVFIHWRKAGPPPALIFFSFLVQVSNLAAHYSRLE